MNTEAAAPAEAATVEAPAARKAAKRPLFKRTCAECGEAFKGPRDARFCTTAHRNAYHNRAMKRGKVAMPLVLAWRNGKNKSGREVGSWAFRELCAAADMWNAEDRKAGRMMAWDFVRPKMAEGWKALDLND